MASFSAACTQRTPSTGTIGLLSWPPQTILGRSSAQISSPIGTGMTAGGVRGGIPVDASRATLVRSRVTQYGSTARNRRACRRSAHSLLATAR